MSKLKLKRSSYAFSTPSAEAKVQYFQVNPLWSKVSVLASDITGHSKTVCTEVFLFSLPTSIKQTIVIICPGMLTAIWASWHQRRGNLIYSKINRHYSKQSYLIKDKIHFFRECIMRKRINKCTNNDKERHEIQSEYRCTNHMTKNWGTRNTLDSLYLVQEHKWATTAEQ